jgi:hypothetical protein
MAVNQVNKHTLGNGVNTHTSANQVIKHTPGNNTNTTVNTSQRHSPCAKDMAHAEMTCSTLNTVSVRGSKLLRSLVHLHDA